MSSPDLGRRSHSVRVRRSILCPGDIDSPISRFTAGTEKGKGPAGDGIRSRELGGWVVRTCRILDMSVACAVGCALHMDQLTRILGFF